jgi:hypothetical protein
VVTLLVVSGRLLGQPAGKGMLPGVRGIPPVGASGRMGRALDVLLTICLLILFAFTIWMGAEVVEGNHRLLAIAELRARGCVCP